jgi:hypothetical protein
MVKGGGQDQFVGVPGGVDALFAPFQLVFCHALGHPGEQPRLMITAGT